MHLFGRSEIFLRVCNSFFSQLTRSNRHTRRIITFSRNTLLVHSYVHLFSCFLLVRSFSLCHLSYTRFLLLSSYVCVCAPYVFLYSGADFPHIDLYHYPEYHVVTHGISALIPNDHLLTSRKCPLIPSFLSPSSMSFKAPRGPRLSAATPLRRTWAPARGDSVKAPRRLRKKGVVLSPQVDITVGGKSFAQRRSRPLRQSSTARPVESTPSRSRGQDSQLIEWERWQKLIVDMVPTYLRLLEDSSNLRSVRRDTPRTCGCTTARNLSVTVYGFDGG